MLLRLRQQYLFWFFVFVLFTCMVYGLPRFLVSSLGEQNPWISYIYTYSLGGFVFVASLIRLYNTGKARKIWIIALCLGLCWGLLIHGLWIYFSISFPFKG